MLTISKLLRHAEREESALLLAAVARNGSPFPLAAGARIAEAGNMQLAALGAALRRAVELSYTPTPELETLLSHLLAGLAQRSTTGVPTREFAGRVFALTGIAEYLTLTDFASADTRGAARARAAAELCARQLVSPEGRILGDEIDAAITLWQLGARQEHLGSAGRELVSAAEARLDLVNLADHPACVDILALNPRRLTRSARGRRAA